MKWLQIFLFLLCFQVLWSQHKKGALTPMNAPHFYQFFENKGQWPDQVLFKADKMGGKVWVLEQKLIYHLQDLSAYRHAHGHEMEEPEIHEHLVHVQFLNSNPISTLEKTDRIPFYYNYFIGKDSTKWANQVHGYNHVVRKELYQGIDLVLNSRGENQEFSYHIQPGSYPSQIQLRYAGQNSLSVDRKGNLIIETELGKVSEEGLYAYQEIDGERKEVKCKFLIEQDIVSFQLGQYDSNRPLIIDPVLVFATYNGAISDNFGMTATYSSDGSAFSGGMVYGNNFPMPAAGSFDPNSNFTAVQGNYGITDVFITKYNPTGTTLLWSTFLGGGNMVQGTETANSMICDSMDNICIFGATSSVDFPTTVGAFQTSHNGGVPGADFLFNGVYFLNQGTDLYVTKISGNGQNLLASTYVGGSANDGVNYKITSLPYNGAFLYDSLTTNYGDQFRGEIMLDANENVLIASCSRSANFPTASPVQGSLAGGQDGVIFRLSPNMNAMLFSSYYGGTYNDACYSVKIDTLNNVLVCGGTSSQNLLGTVGGFQSTYQGGKSDGFVFRLNPAGTSITAATYVGRGDYDQTFFVEIDRNNNVFILGQSAGGNFPIWNAPYNNPNSSQFVIKLNNALSTNLASATIGNGSTQINISPSAFLVDICGNIYISGWGANILQNIPISGMPITNNAFQPNSTGYDFYLMTIEHDFQSLLYATYMGGPNAHEHVDGGTSRFDKNGVVYQSVCGGCGGWSDFPTTPGAYSSTNNSVNCNNLLFKFDFQLIPTAQFIANQTMGCEDFQVTFNNFSSQNDSYLWDFGNNNTSSTIFNPTITYTNPGVYQVYLYVTDSVCNLTDTAEITITVLDSIEFTLFDTLGLCSNQPYILGINTNGTASNFIWSQNPSFIPPLNNPNDSTILITSANPGWYYVTAMNSFCEKTDSVFVLFDVPVIANYQPSPESGCSPVTVQFNNSSTVTTNFYWDFGNGIIDSLNFEPQITFTLPGQYITQLIILDTLCNASDTSSIVINVYPSVSFDLPNSLYLCVDTSLTLVPTNILGNPNSFVWSSNLPAQDTLNISIQDSSLEVLVPTTSIVYLTANNGNCSYTDSIEITVFTDAVSISGPDSVCLNVPQVYTAINNSQENFSYIWSPSTIIQGQNNQSAVTVTPPMSQYLYMQATSANGCIVNDSLYIGVSYINPAWVQANAVPGVVNPGTTVSLIGSPPGYPSYLWVPSGLAQPSNTMNSQATVDETTVFTLYVSDGICTVSDTTEVKVYEIICDMPYVFVPNAFSPNNDNNNDVLFVRGLFVEKMVFRVFDRWGELVFESTDVNYGWDGIYQGKKLDPDVFDYYLQVTCYGGLEKIIKGNVTLMK